LRPGDPFGPHSEDDICRLIICLITQGALF
jgi:hypothetical protein